MLRYLMSYPNFFFRFIRPVHGIPKRINGNISKKLHEIWKILFILGSYEFLACLECISRNGLSFGHSDWDISSVICFEKSKSYSPRWSKKNEYYWIYNRESTKNKLFVQCLNVRFVKWPNDPKLSWHNIFIFNIT
jgi:hypothetical protein